MTTQSFNKPLSEFFDYRNGTIDARDLYQALVVYANQYLNYYSNPVDSGCEAYLIDEMKKNAEAYELEVIAEYKDIILKDLNGYSESYKIEFEKEFKEACEDWSEFFKVLDWIKENFNWESGSNYFESFVKFSENEPTLIKDFHFEEYAKDLAEDCYMRDLRRNDGNNPILDYIDWKGWADFVMGDYTEIVNPLKEENFIYYRSY